MPWADEFEQCANRGGDHFTVTGAERFNHGTQLLACTVACRWGQAEIHVHFARNGNGIETGANIRNSSAGNGIYDFRPGSFIARRCIQYARENPYVGFPF